MLIEFSVENFRSIKEKVTLSLLASSDKSLDNNLIKTDGLKKDNLLRSAVIYGANASGKTNIVLAFSFLQKLVLNSHQNQKDDKLDLSPFKFDKEYISKPSKFEIVFLKNNIKHIYGVSATKEKIIDEYLYFYPPKGRKSIIFERKNTNHFRFTKDKEEQKFISERTINNVLYLSSSTQLNYKITSDIFDWFKYKLQTIDDFENPKWIQSTIDLLNEDNQSKELVLKALLEADLGIGDVIASIEKISSNELPPKKIKKGQYFWGDEEGFKTLNIETIHKIIDEKNEVSYIPIDYFDESGGTRKIFEMIGTWINALKNGHILIVDELDVKLHNFLNLFLIKLFHDTTQNLSNAQLIFTTHNTNLLDLDLFRRDQIWFTDKNPNSGSTDLYSLMEYYSPRKDMDIQKGYLAGRFGAIPFINDERIF